MGKTLRRQDKKTRKRAKEQRNARKKRKVKDGISQSGREICGTLHSSYG